MIIDFSKIELKDIDGVVAVKSGFHKVVANIMYTTSESIDFVEPAIEINKGLAVELTKKQILEIEKMILNPKAGILTFARKAFSEFVEDRLAEEAKKKKE